MPTISKISFSAIKAVSFQGNQQQTVSMPVMPKYGLPKDTISFKANEEELMKLLFPTSNLYFLHVRL
ncbi:MAG: hypothetical protein WC197_06085 [Candidatus Gastranaerophilaceae bacterium]|jgi:hypothetical protein